MLVYSVKDLRHISVSIGIQLTPFVTHKSLAFFLWDIGKQNSPRCDPAECGVPSGTNMFAFMNFI